MEKLIDLNKAIERYINNLSSDKKSENTIINYQVTFTQFIKYTNDKKIDMVLDFKDFKALIFDFVESIKTYEDKDGVKKEYAVSTVNPKRTHIRELISYLYDREQIPEDFSNKVKILKRVKGDPRAVLTMEEIKKIISTLNKEIASKTRYESFLSARNKFLFVVLLTTGMRISEGVRIKWSDIDIRENKLYVTKAKGNKKRWIPITQDLKFQIYDYENLLKELKDYGYDLEHDYIFFSSHNNNKPMTAKNGGLIINKIMKLSGIEKKITAHGLRHTMASHYISNNGKIPVLADILGHESPRITLEVYAHIISENEKKDDMNRSLNYNIG